MRLFIGIPLDAAVVEELAALTERLKSLSDGLRWSAAAGWHITLQFLGKTSVEQYECVTSGLSRIKQTPFEIQLEPPGFFDRAGVFFAGVRPSSDLTGLQQKVVATTKPCGFIPEDRPYHPHITLARDKSGSQSLRRLKPRVPGPVRFSHFVAREFLLYESFPGPGGSRYEVRERFAFTYS
jgi:RNA 2',3'-cyclic 3'-phosphodiesterase